VKTLTIGEALIALGKGEKVTADCMVVDFIFLEDNTIKLSDGSEYEGLLDIKHLKGENLRIYEEPKKMIKVAKYAFFYSGWLESTHYYKDDSDCKTSLGKNKIKRLNNTEIEVEDY